MPSAWTDLDDALDAERPADGRRVATAKLRHEPVVAPARTDGALGSQTVGHPLEHGAGVIVEPAHEPRVQGEPHADVREQRLTRAKCARDSSSRYRPSAVRPRSSSRRAGFLLSRIRSGLRSRRRKLSSSSSSRWREKCSDQHFLVRLARLAVPIVLSSSFMLYQPELAPQARRQRDELDVDLGLGKAERLDAHLVELPITAFLRFLAPNIGPDTRVSAAVVQQAVAQSSRGRRQRSPRAAA